MSRLLLPAALLAAATSCDFLGLKEETFGDAAPQISGVAPCGSLCLAFAGTSWQASAAAAPDVPDTNAFLLSVRDASGKSVYEGAYGAAPERMTLGAGSYTVKVVSAAFDKPAFSAPQYGDEQVVTVPAGAAVNLRLNCRQLNAGVRLSVSPDFLTAQPDGVLFLDSARGRLMYCYAERRIAYFQPGTVSLLLSGGETLSTLSSWNLKACEVLSVGVSCAVSAGESGSSGSSADAVGLSMCLDTARTWLTDSCLIGGEATGGSSPETAYGVAQARSHTGEKGVWVKAYIVGGDLTSSASGISFAAPFSSRTHVAVSARSSVSEKSACLSVMLPSGSLRDDLNLVDHPENLGRQVFLKGDLVEAYFGIPGLKNLSDYRWK